MKLVIFDFCETLVNFQTADCFSRFVLEKESRNFILKTDLLLDKMKFYKFCSKFNLDSCSQKKILLTNLNGLNKEKEYFGYGIKILNYMDVNKRVCNEENYQPAR